MPISEIPLRIRKEGNFMRYIELSEGILVNWYNAEQQAKEIDTNSVLYVQKGTTHFSLNHGREDQLFLDWQFCQLTGIGRIRLQSLSENLVKSATFDIRYKLQASLL